MLTGRSPVRRVRPRERRRLDVRLLVPALVAWPVVAFWGLLADLLWVVVAAGACLVLAAGAARRGARGREVAAVLAVLGLALGAAAGHRALRSAGPVERLAAERAVVVVEGVVVAEPRPVGGEGGGGGGADGERGAGAAPGLVLVRVEVSRVVGRGHAADVSTPVLVLSREPTWSRVSWHDEVTAVLRLGPAEPGDDVVAVATPRGPVRVVAPANGVFAAAEVVRGRLRDATDGLWPDARGLVPALVVGDVSRTPPALTTAMLATGLTHLSAVSGSNVTLVLASVGWLCSLVGVRRRWRPPVGGIALAAFVVVARPEPSVVRAAVMGLVGLLALSASRRRDGPPALAGAVVALLVWDPWLSRSFGFALSAVATLGLLVLARPWGERLAVWLPGPVKPLGPVLAVPVVAQVVCAPLVVPLQGNVSVVAVLANLLAAPFVGPTTVLGVAVALLGVGSVPVAAVLAWPAALPAQCIGAVARWSASLPAGSVAWGDSAGAAVLLAGMTVAGLAVAPWAWHRSRHRPAVALAVVVLTAGSAVPTSVIAWPPPGWVLVVCDVGQGDGLVVDAGDGHAVVVDAGPEPAAMRRCLDRIGVRTVDLLVLTHYHSDHVGGVSAVLERPVTEIRATPVRDPPDEAARVARLAGTVGVPVADLHAGEHVSVGAVEADVWWPARRIDAGSVPNNASVVLTVHVRGLTLLLAGDIEREAAAQVLHASRLDPVRWGHVDVLKVAHHGSANRDDRLLDEVDGRLALVSVGAGNDYGHPAAATLEALQDRGFEVHRTDREGDLAVVADDRVARVMRR